MIRFVSVLTLLAAGSPAVAQELDLPPVVAPPAPPATATALGGYGELHVSSAATDGAGRSGEVDYHRFVLFFSHAYDDAFRFYAELETEHAFVGEGMPGELELEQALLEYGAPDAPVTLRAGLLLMPFGHLNRDHEPTRFHGVERPRLSSVVIPTTWREAGVGVAGRAGERIRYEAYLVSGLNAAGFDAVKGLKGGRTGVAEAYAGEPAVVGRVSWQPVSGLEVALSGYHGDAGANHPTKRLEVGVTGAALDLRYRANALEVRSEVAGFALSGSDKLADEGGPGSQIAGGYLEAGLDLFELAGLQQELVPFVRLEHTDTTLEAEAGLPDPATAVTDLVAGISWRPIPQVVFKADHIVRTPEQGEAQQITSVGLGYLF